MHFISRRTRCARATTVTEAFAAISIGGDDGLDKQRAPDTALVTAGNNVIAFGLVNVYKIGHD